MSSASSTVCPPGKYASSVREIGSSGPSVRSPPCECRCECSRGTIRNVTSGASKLRPSELAYFFSIMSLTSSTKSSSLIDTSVAEAPGLFTQIFRCSMLALIVGGPPK